MSIGMIINKLNSEGGYGLSSQYYTNIKTWLAWWRGFYQPFHEFVELASDNRRIKRKLYKLPMARKVCSDWATVLLNEETQIVVEDEASSMFLQGEDGFGGVFGDNNFWQEGNALVEKAFATGTGAFVVKFTGMHVSGDTVLRSSDTKIMIDYIPAQNIIPLTVRNQKVVEAAFVSESIEKGKKHIYLETHELENGSYTIKNRYFECENEQLVEKELPAGVAPAISTGSDIPLFATIKPNAVNTFTNSQGMGMSVYAHAIDNLMGVDLAFNNFCRDLKLSGKKVFYNASLIKSDLDGNLITPDDVAQQLFMTVGDEIMNENGMNKLVHEFNPTLRVQENADAVQSQLDYLSFMCGLGTKHYQFNANTVVTATQYMGDKQELVQNASRHYIIIEQALKQLVKAILWAGKELLGHPCDPDTGITVNFEDGYIIDKESERERDKQDVREGLMQKWEFRVKWYGEDEETAKLMTQANDSIIDDFFSGSE